VKSVLPGIPLVVLFSYEDRAYEKWNELIEDICKLLPSPDVVLRLPAIGANNQVPFFQSAFAIFRGIRTYFRDNKATTKPKQIHLMTLFSTEELSSTRVIFHFVRLMELDKKDLKTHPCMYCLAQPPDLIFSTCGHRVLCLRCNESLEQRACQQPENQQLADRRCLDCSTPFTPDDVIFCLTVVDHSKVCTSFRCCAQMYDRANQVFTPCGCYKCVCTTCAANCAPDQRSLAEEARAPCPACKKRYEMFTVLYYS